MIAGWGLEEAWRRAEAYAEAGADAILIHSKAKTPDEIQAFIQGWSRPVPLVVVLISYSQVTTRTIAETEADYEFIGIARLSPAGSKVLKEV